MRGKNKKTTYFDFLPYECSAAEEYLEEMAEKGWLLQSINGAFFKFKRIEPSKIKYSVDVYHMISDFDYKDSDTALVRRDHYREAGWSYICQIGKIQVFYTEDYENTLPISNEAERFKSVFKASLGRAVSQLILILLFILNLYMQLFMGSIDFTLATNIGILSVLALGSVVFINTILITNFIIWAVKSRLRLKKGEAMAYNNSRQVRSKNVLMVLFEILLMVALLQVLISGNHDIQIIGIAILLIMLVAAVIFIFVRIFINKKRYSKNTNLVIYTVSSIVTVVLLIDVIGATIFRNIEPYKSSEAPIENKLLTVKDFGKYQNIDEAPYVKIDKSILAQRIDYSGTNNRENFMYTYFESKSPWVVKCDKNRVISRLNKVGYDLKEINSKLPDNVKVYKSSYYKYFVLASENRVVNIKNGFSDVDDERLLSLVYDRLFKD